MVDAYSVVELERLEFLQREQPKLRCDLCSGIQDYLAQDTVDPALIGRMTILPSPFTGGDHAMQQFYQDSMALVKHFGKPDLFITFTANPKWEEINAELRPDIAAGIGSVHICDDLARRLETFNALPDIPSPEEDYGLHLIGEALLTMRRTLAEFRLPRPQHDWSRDTSNPLIRHELDCRTESSGGSVPTSQRGSKAQLRYH